MEVGLHWKSRSVRDCNVWEEGGGGGGGRGGDAKHINTLRDESEVACRYVRW